jgi:hypothetical protein
VICDRGQEDAGDSALGGQDTRVLVLIPLVGRSGWEYHSGGIVHSFMV